jgi:hypothetical protein
LGDGRARVDAVTSARFKERFVAAAELARDGVVAFRGRNHGVRVEVWFQDEARIGQKNSLTRVWGQTGSRPVVPKDLGFASAYIFGAVCPSAGKAAALIMPICIPSR